MEEVFKVVRGSHGLYRSWGDHPFQVGYVIGQKSTPMTGADPLMAFPSEFWANWFATTFSMKGLSELKIMRCNSVRSEKQPKDYYPLFKNIPDQTIFCDIVIPLEVVKDYSK